MGKKTLLVCYTDRGRRKMEEAARILAGTGRETVCLARPRGGAFLGEYWGQVREIVFIGAAGIAVRLCAPYVRDKFQDPAVVVLDEGGQFAVPILSGHMGGANDLARLLSEETGAAAVITTATDVNGRFAVDEFARKAGLVVTDREAAKRVSACILQGEPVGFYSALPVRGPVPEELTAVRDTESLVGFPAAVLVEERPGRAGQTPAHILRLFPRNLTAGMGCRRGVPARELEAFLLGELEELGCHPAQVRRLASIDRKREEEGLLALARKLAVPFETWTAAQLAAVSPVTGDSPFVEETVGVGNVCERAALLYGGRLVLAKKARDGMTLALAAEDWSVEFG